MDIKKVLTMHSCSYCNYVTQRKDNLNEHINAKHSISQYDCSLCEFKTKWRRSFNRHVAGNHNNQASQQLEFQPSFQQQSQDLDGSYDIRLKENFKLLISGPSRCGKTVFTSKLIENISLFAKQPASTIIYVYKVS